MTNPLDLKASPDVTALVNKAKAHKLAPADVTRFLDKHDGKANWSYFVSSGLYADLTKAQPSISTWLEAKSGAITVVTNGKPLSDANAPHRVFPYDDSTVIGDDPSERLGQVVDAVTSPFEAVQKLIGALFSVQLWIRVLEALVALMLIGIGLSKLANGTALGNAADKVVKNTTGQYFRQSRRNAEIRSRVRYWNLNNNGVRPK